MPPTSDPEEVIVPVHTEQAEVTRRSTITGRVTVSTLTRVRDELIDELLMNERAEIERVPIGQFVDAAPRIREDGETIVIPVVEEVLIAERRLFLKEEVRVRRVKTMVRHQQAVTLREQEAVITRATESATNHLPTEGEDASQAK